MGRNFPVEMRYRPLIPDAVSDVGTSDVHRSQQGSGEGRDQVQAVIDAVEELSHEGPGDVLVFLSGEREIHDTADALRRLDLSGTEVLPLYARLSSAEQHKIFERAPMGGAGRRIVLATNVAETSLTVPGVRYVVDAGTARISRYSRRLKVQRLPIEPVSRASANQRAGRCGRVAPGICIRLFAEDDFELRPEFTDPEILRTNLASVILQMTAIGLGDVARFPFVEPPDHRSIVDGYALLDELAAVRPAPDGLKAGPRRLTKIGRDLARLPVDPRLGRMVLEAQRLGCVREVLVIASALSIQDPANVRRTSASRPTSSTTASRSTAPTCCRSSRCGTTSARSSVSCRATSSVACVARSSSTTYASGSGWICSASSDASPASSESGRRPTMPIPITSIRRCWRDCCRTSGCATGRHESSSVPASHAS